MVDLRKECDIAVSAVAKACQLCQNVRAALVSDETLAKKDKSPVTVADFGAQAVIIAELLGAFPGANIVAEEDAAELRETANAGLLEKVIHHVAVSVPRLDKAGILGAIDSGKYSGGSSGRFWTIDPIDGTKGFLRGEQYAIALALIEDGQVVLGILGCPNLPLDSGQSDGLKGCVFVAAKGEGAFMWPIKGGQKRKVSVTQIADPSRASFCESVESGHSSHGHAARIAAVLGVAAPPFRIDSQCKYAAVARGDASIYLRLPTKADYEEKIWDHAAGWLIVKEAGGEVTDIHGRPLDFSVGRTLGRNKGVVATNGRLHHRVIQAVRQILG